MCTKELWSGLVRILYPQSTSVRLVRSEKYTHPIKCISTYLELWSTFEKAIFVQAAKYDEHQHFQLYSIVMIITKSIKGKQISSTG